MKRDDAFLKAANAAAENVKEPGQFARIGDTDFVVAMDDNGDHFIWDVDLMGHSAVERKLIRAINSTDDKIAKEAMGAAWQSLSELATKAAIRGMEQGKPDPWVTLGARYASELRAKDSNLKKLTAAKKAATYILEMHGKIVTPDAVRKRL